MADYDIRSGAAAGVALALATRTATATSGAIDMNGWKGLTIGVLIGAGGITFTGTNYLAVTITHSDDDATYAAVEEEDMILSADQSWVGDGIVRKLIAAKGSADAEFDLYGYRGKKQYVKVEFTFGGTHATGTPTTAVWFKGKKMSTPNWTVTQLRPAAQ